MKKPTLWVGLWILLLSFGIWTIARGKRASTPLPTLWPAPVVSFEGVSSAGARAMSTKDFQGKIWIANFIFTRCGGPCPVMSGKMAALQRTLPPAVQFVSFTVDPDFDKSPILQDYASRFRADPNRWVFARTTKETLFKMVNEGFKLPVVENRTHPPETRVLHSTNFVLVDASGVVRGYYESTGERFMERVADGVRSLQKERA